MAEQPIYRRIADRLREQIESGDLVPGQKLPTETQLRKEHDASRNTIRDAIKWLTSLGLVETRPGQGTFVVKKVDPFITTLSADTGTGLGGGEGATYLSQVSEQDREASSTVPQVEMQIAAGEVAARLQLEAGAQIISRHQRRYIDGTPWSLQTSFYPRGLAKGADRLLEPGDIAEGTVRYLAETLGLRQVGYRDWITVRTPNETEAEFFKLPEDGRVGIFEVFRTAYDQTGAPMRLTVTIFPTDRNQFVVNDGQVPPILARRDAGTKKSLANPLQAGQTTLHRQPRWRPPIPQGPYIGADQVLSPEFTYNGAHLSFPALDLVSRRGGRGRAVDAFHPEVPSEFLAPL